jgi:hypothetical protein
MSEVMTTFVVKLPVTEKYRLGMFGRNALQVVPAPKLASLNAAESVVVVRSTFRTVGKIARMFPNWQFQALIE